MTNFPAIVKATRAAAAAQQACSKYRREAAYWRDEGDSHRRLAARYPDGEPHNMGCLEAAATCAPCPAGKAAAEVGQVL